jgi:hypothetical protein
MGTGAFIRAPTICNIPISINTDFSSVVLSVLSIMFGLLLEAIDKHGLLSGIILTIKRLLKCHPFHSGGVDLVSRTRARKLRPYIPTFMASLRNGASACTTFKDGGQHIVGAKLASPLLFIGEGGVQ